MIDNLRFEISFKNILQLEKKLEFCASNNIDKINIPCKGLIKKQFLNEIIEYIGKNHKGLDVIYHYSLYHQYSKNRNFSYLELLKFIKKCNSYNNYEILLVSGTNKKKNFEVMGVMYDLKKEKNLNTNIGIAYNPYLENYYDIYGERERFQKKFSMGLTKSIWLQFGTDIPLLEAEINYLKKYICNDSLNLKDQKVKVFGSLLIPSRQFISRFKFRPWKGVYISEKYLYSLESFNEFIKDLLELYLEYNIYPIIETECSTFEQLEKINTLFKN